MDLEKFNTLSLIEQEDFIKKEGKLLEAEDDYSYRLLFYVLDEHTFELMYDNETDLLVSVTFLGEDNTRNIEFDPDDF
jgi:hypothetical protein